MPLRERPQLVVRTDLPENSHQRTIASALPTGKASAGISSFLDVRVSKDSPPCHRKPSGSTSVSYWPICCLDGELHPARKN